jgi:hypothetical protein
MPRYRVTLYLCGMRSGTQASNAATDNMTKIHTSIQQCYPVMQHSNNLLLIKGAYLLPLLRLQKLRCQVASVLLPWPPTSMPCLLRHFRFQNHPPTTESVKTPATTCPVDTKQTRSTVVLHLILTCCLGFACKSCDVKPHQFCSPGHYQHALPAEACQVPESSSNNRICQNTSHHMPCGHQTDA